MSKDKKKAALLKAVSLCILSALFVTGCADRPPAEALPQEGFMTVPSVNYQTLPVEKGTYTQTDVDTLSIVYAQTEDLSWDQDNARYKEVFVKKKQTVKAGDVLISFEIEGSEAELAALQLQLQRAREKLESGSASKEREIRDRKEAAEGLEAYDRQIALLEAEKLQAEYEQFLYQTGREVAQLERSIADIEAEVENNVLRAPFDGIVSKVVDYNPGDKVIPGQVLVTVYSPDNILLKARKATNSLYNMPVTVETVNNGATYTGRVVVAPNILPSSLEQDAVLIQLDEKVPAALLSGSRKLTYESQQLQDVLTVSRSAVKSEGEKQFVYVLEGNMIRKRYVEIKTNSSATAWVLDGLSEGMTVIAE